MDKVAVPATLRFARPVLKVAGKPQNQSRDRFFATRSEDVKRPCFTPLYELAIRKLSKDVNALLVKHTTKQWYYLNAVSNDCNTASGCSPNII